MTNAIIINDKVYIPQNDNQCRNCDLNKHNCRGVCFIFGNDKNLKEIKDFTYIKKDI